MQKAWMHLSFDLIPPLIMELAVLEGMKIFPRNSFPRFSRQISRTGIIIIIISCG